MHAFVRERFSPRLPPGSNTATEKPVSFQYGLRARYPLEATAPAYETYLHYNKDVSAEAAPVALEVQ